MPCGFELQKRFFRDLVSSALRAPVYIGALYSHSETLNGKITQVWDYAYNIEDWCERLEPILEVQPHSINYTPVLRREPHSGNTSVSFAPALWVDIDDYLWDDWRQGQYAVLQGTVFEPTVCVDSGWGVHLYWLLDEGIDLTDSDKRAAFEKTASLLAWMLSADIQSSCSPSHLMRLPGSYNCKSAPYYKECKIEYTKRGRVSFRDISDNIIEYAEGWLKRYKLSPSGGEKISTMAAKLERILNPSYQPQNTAAVGVKNYERIKGDVDELERLLRAEAHTCPLVDMAVNHSESIGFPEWMAFGCGLAKVLGNDTAEELFYKFSYPGNHTVDPDNDIRGQFRRWAARNLMPANCDTKLSIGCNKAGKTCKSILKVLRRAWRKL